MTAWKIIGLVGLFTILSGCARSPEARRHAYVTEGKDFLKTKDYSRAILAFRNAAKVKPNDAESMYQIGVASLGLMDLRTAVASFKRALELDPKHVQAQLKLAQIMATSSEDVWVKQAESRLNTLVENSSITPEMLDTLAMVELKLGKTESGIETLERALTVQPQQLSSSIMLARAKLLQQDVKGAEAVLVKACDNAPSAASPRVTLGEFYTSQSRLGEGEAEFRSALNIDPNNGMALLDLALLQYYRGRKQEAEENFKRVASLDKAGYTSTYGLFLFREGRKDEAVREFERLVNHNPGDRFLRTRLVAAYQSVGRSIDARKIVDNALKKNSKDMDALLQRAEMARNEGKYSEAEADLNLVLRLQPDSGEMHYIMARLHQARGASLSYRQQLSEALRLNPYLLSARLEFVQQFITNKEYRAATDVLNATPESQKQLTAIRVQQNWVLWAANNLTEMRKGIDTGLARERSVDLLIQDGLWKLRTGNPGGARTSMEEALKMSPSDVRALRAMTMTYVAQKQNALALQKAKEYAATQPKSAVVQEFLGLLLISTGDRAQARTAFEAAKAADPKSVRADLSLIQTDLLDGKLDDAHRKLQAVLSVNGSDAVVRLWMGNIELMKGNSKAALEHYKQVIAIDSNNAEALNNLAFLLAESGKPSEALKYAQKAKEMQPDSAEYSDTLGWILYHQGLYSLAVKELERTVAKPDNPVWGYHLAMAYAKAGDPKRGRATLRAALERNPNLPEAKAAQELLGTEK
jgi:tetratricopeptide (TPR) repeat protein